MSQNASPEETGVLNAVACVLQLTTEQNDNLQPVQNLPRFSFHMEKVPDAGVEDYCRHLGDHFDVTPALYPVLMLYMYRAVSNRKGLVINSFTVHRLLLTSFTLLAKYYEDLHFSNSYYAKVGGLDLEELNALEKEMLTIISFDLSIPPQVYLYYIESLKKHIAGCQRCASRAAEQNSLLASATDPGTPPPRHRSPGLSPEEGLRPKKKQMRQRTMPKETKKPKNFN